MHLQHQNIASTDGLVSQVGRYVNMALWYRFQARVSKVSHPEINPH